MDKYLSSKEILQYSEKPIIKAVTLAYFSGTGGTEAIVRCVEAQLIRAGIKVNSVDIPFCTIPVKEIDSDLLIIFSPVYAFRLASVVERWARNLPCAKNTSAAVISVSGGGEISPNTACRAYCKRLLTRKGYSVVYEKMLVMPSNFVIQAEHNINLRLISAMPRKAEQMVKEILSGKVSLKKPKPWDYALAFFGRAEHFGARIFGFSLRASETCTNCGLCERKCPVKNIKLVNGVPSFGLRCILCLKCVYRCPQRAVSPRLLRFSVFKNGYDLEGMSKEAKGLCGMESEFPKSIFWQGVIDYLKSNTIG